MLQQLKNTHLAAVMVVKPGRMQGLLTNDVNGLGKEGAMPVYAALLNAQGRHLHELFLYRGPGSPIHHLEVLHGNRLNMFPTRDLYDMFSSCPIQPGLSIPKVLHADVEL